MNYDDWKTTEPDPFAFEPRDDNDEPPAPEPPDDDPRFWPDADVSLQGEADARCDPDPAP